MIKKIFLYIEPIWLGADNKISIRRTLAIAFSIDFTLKLTRIVYVWEIGKSYADARILLGIEAGLIIAMLSLATYSNSIQQKIDSNGRSDNSSENTTSASQDKAGSGGNL